jgi:2-iminobutanoate/2-iminopropanoate deaminase
MKRRVGWLAFLIAVCISSVGETPVRKHVMLDSSEARRAYPFSDAVVAGDTVYVSGTVGFERGKVPASAEDEARLALEGVQRVLESQGMEMDDLVSVQVFCTDFSLYDKFNSVYRGFFHEQFPARAFIGAASLIRGAHFELMGVAVRRAK